MYIYNTLSGQKEDLDNVLGGKKDIRLFVCGPTVYNYIHIGNARTYIAFDNIVRYLRLTGFKVFYLQNITDIDDKIIRRANEEKLIPKEIAKKYEKSYHEDEKSLGIDTITKYAPATRYIKQIVKQVQILINKSHAYKIEDGYYFDLTTFPDYGKLAKRTVLQAEDSTSRIDENPNKRNKGDFVLWKFSKPGEPFWKTSLGAGRPGWHIEDTAITEYHFGPQYDLHGGAIDLKFPHHEAEIAQQEAASGKKPMVKIWMHPGFLNVGGEKMSKSFKGFITVREFLKQYPAIILRQIIASHHYRSSVEYSEALVEQAKNSLLNTQEFLIKLETIRKGAGAKENKLMAEWALANADQKFHAAMQDDFNTPEAMAALFNLINEINKNIWELNKKQAVAVSKFLRQKLKIFKIDLKLPKIPSKIKKLVQQRELFRSNKQFIQADRLRKEMEGLGYVIEDSPIGPVTCQKNL
ncbi:MAG: cysteine--tRNA ligase [Patescibacteria group bacterium]